MFSFLKSHPEGRGGGGRAPGRVAASALLSQGSSGVGHQRNSQNSAERITITKCAPFVVITKVGTLGASANAFLEHPAKMPQSRESGCIGQGTCRKRQKHECRLRLIAARRVGSMRNKLKWGGGQIMRRRHIWNIMRGDIGGGETNNTTPVLLADCARSDASSYHFAAFDE